MTDSFSQTFLAESAEIATGLDTGAIEALAEGLAASRERGGRLFILGVGGGAGHASHAVNDFRKLCGFEAYAPTDNVSELTARTNDEGWDTSFAEWLRTSRIGADDAVLVFSVGGGSREHNISMNIVTGLELAGEAGAFIGAIVGKADGAAAQLADAPVVVRAPSERLTPHTEAFQAVVWHLLVSHPRLARSAGKWESIAVKKAERGASAPGGSEQAAQPSNEI